MAFHPDGNCIAAGTTDHVVKVGRVNRGGDMMYRFGGGG